ncbi:hypothetical protein [Aurantimonas marina]|uniref:hypothetical protein n=1 Tax=Aurantimonas marina TaxID=2780508 RepID=UPI0019CF7CD8|nr:hypothetical protein [Aurantimonas marina]
MNQNAAVHSDEIITGLIDVTEEFDKDPYHGRVDELEEAVYRIRGDAGKSCPSCGKNTIEALVLSGDNKNPIISGHVVHEGDSSGAYIPSYLFTCTNCGFIMSFLTEAIQGKY